MMWRKVALALVVGILVCGLAAVASARKPPTRGGPDPKPWECGDPDWPAFSNDFGIDRWLFAEDPSEAERSWSMTRDRIRSRAIKSPGTEVRLPSGRYQVRALGHTITIRR